MRKSLKILVDAKTFYLSEEKVKLRWRYGTVPVFYVDGTYSDNMRSLIELSMAVKSDYPQVRLSEMQVKKLSAGESEKHSGMTAIKVDMPIKDYLRLKEQRKIIIK